MPTRLITDIDHYSVVLNLAAVAYEASIGRCLDVLVMMNTLVSLKMELGHQLQLK